MYSQAVGSKDGPRDAAKSDGPSGSDPVIVIEPAEVGMVVTDDYPVNDDDDNNVLLFEPDEVVMAVADDYPVNDDDNVPLSQVSLRLFLNKIRA